MDDAFLVFKPIFYFILGIFCQNINTTKYFEKNEEICKFEKMFLIFNNLQ